MLRPASANKLLVPRYPVHITSISGLFSTIGKELLALIHADREARTRTCPEAKAP